MDTWVFKASEKRQKWKHIWVTMRTLFLLMTFLKNCSRLFKVKIISMYYGVYATRRREMQDDHSTETGKGEREPQAVRSSPRAQRCGATRRPAGTRGRCALQTLKQPRKHHDEVAAKKPAKEMTKAIRRANRDHRTGGISGK